MFQISDRCREYGTSELKEVCEYVVNKCNELSKQIERNENGEAVYNGDIDKAISLAVKKWLGLIKDTVDIHPTQSLFFSVI